MFSENKLTKLNSIKDIKKTENIILKIFLEKFLFTNKELLLFNKIKYTSTPIHVDTEVAIGIIVNPISLKKIKLIPIFKKTTRLEI